MSLTFLVTNQISGLVRFKRLWGWRGLRGYGAGARVFVSNWGNHLRARLPVNGKASWASTRSAFDEGSIPSHFKRTLGWRGAKSHHSIRRKSYEQQNNTWPVPALYLNYLRLAWEHSFLILLIIYAPDFLQAGRHPKCRLFRPLNNK